MHGPADHTDRKRQRRRQAQRDYRRRLVAGRIMVSVMVDADVVELLISARWLLADESGDRRKIGQAVGSMLAASAKNKP
jgi:hypothetical protein